MGTQGSWFWGDRDLGGSFSSLSVGPSSLCIPSGQSQGKEDTAVPREGLGGGWDMAGPGLQAALEPFPAFLASPREAVVGGEGGSRTWRVRV